MLKHPLSHMALIILSLEIGKLHSRLERSISVTYHWSKVAAVSVEDPGPKKAQTI